MWVPEAVGRDPFVLAAMLLAATDRLTAATGIANIYARDPVTASSASKTLAEAHPGRFVLGLGVSHAPMVEGVHGREYRSPIATMRSYLDGIDGTFYGTARARSTSGTRARRARSAHARARGRAHRWCAPLLHATRAHRACSRDPRTACVPRARADRHSRARSATLPGVVARGFATGYVGLPNYANNLRRLGYTEDERRASTTASSTRSSRGVTSTRSVPASTSTWTRAPTTSACRCCHTITGRCRSPRGASWHRRCSRARRHVSCRRRRPRRSGTARPPRRRSRCSARACRTAQARRAHPGNPPARRCSPRGT